MSDIIIRKVETKADLDKFIKCQWNFYKNDPHWVCLLYTSDAADERSSVDLGGRRIIKKKNKTNQRKKTTYRYNTDKAHNQI